MYWIRQSLGTEVHTGRTPKGGIPRCMKMCLGKTNIENLVSQGAKHSGTAGTVGVLLGVITPVESRYTGTAGTVRHTGTDGLNIRSVNSN